MKLKNEGMRIEMFSDSFLFIFFCLILKRICRNGESCNTSFLLKDTKDL